MAEKKAIKLLSPFPKKLVRPAPSGKFGDYVPHAHYVERLRDSGVKYSWACEPIYGMHKGEKRIVGAIGTITIEDMGSYMGVGDIDTFKLDSPKLNDGTNLKDAESDAFKRACMRFGLGVELWSGSTQSEEEASMEVEETPATEVKETDDNPKVKASRSKSDFIQDTIDVMCKDLTPAHREFAIEQGRMYAKVKKYPQDMNSWTSEQVNKFFEQIERGALPQFEPKEDIMEDVQAILGDVVNKSHELNKIKTDLKCPYCSEKVFDNRDNKKTPKSPDFVCANNDPAICGGHTGKWRKSWWLNSSDLPEEWGFSE
jgi:hypothetical protein